MVSNDDMSTTPAFCEDEVGRSQDQGQPGKSDSLVQPSSKTERGTEDGV